MASSSVVYVDKGIFQNESLKEKSCGVLVGLNTAKNAISVVGFHSSPAVREVTVDNQLLCLPEIRDSIVVNCYPAGCSVIGVWVVVKDSTFTSDGVKNLQQVLFDLYSEDQLVDSLEANSQSFVSHFPTLFQDKLKVLITITGGDEFDMELPKVVCYCSNISNNNNVGQLTPTTVSSVTSFLTKNVIMFRLKSVLTLQLYAPKNPTDSITKSHVEALRDVIDNGVLWMPHQRTLISNSDTPISSAVHSGKEGPVVVEILQGPVVGVRPPVITLKPVPTVLTLPLQLDVTGVFHTSTGMRTIARLLKNRALNQLETLVNCVKAHQSSVGVHHYSTTTQNLPISIVYPKMSLRGCVPFTDEVLVKEREEWHRVFCLSPTLPQLRKTCIHWREGKSASELYLINPHLYLPTVPSRPDCLVSMVTGSYAYRHYMQDKFNDNGWGCAYRSLQTIWSWFQYQGYTVLEAPSHRDIQETLVDCGDKEKSFIGSKEWIGSFEVSTVLNHKLQIDSRIHQCNRGAEMNGSGPVLARHFQTQGTPVMIGGGVLAHTIIGIEYDKGKGETRFLLLDPHYTGADDLKLVLGKGCVWKTASFWDQMANYNMCMPLRPKEL